MGKRILIQGYFNDNFGDDLIISSFVKRMSGRDFELIFLDNRLGWLKAYNSNVKIPVCLVLMNKIQNKLIAHLPEKLKKVIRKQNTRMINTFIKKQIDVEIQIGGSLYQENAKLAQINRERRMSENELNNLNNTILKPRIVVGCNFGPWQTEFFFEFYKAYFERCKCVYFRDTASFNLFSQLSSCKLATDTAFITNVDIPLNSIEKKVVISVMDLESKFGKETNENYLCNLCEIIKLYHLKGYKTTLVGFCESEGDIIAINNILSRLQGITIDTVVYKKNIDRILSEFASAEIVLATRFHAMILSWLLKKKVYVFAYSKKIINFAYDNNFPQMFLCDVQKNELIHANQIIENFEKFTTYVDIERLYNNNRVNSEKMLKEIIDTVQGIS